jgi:hypothetical protein
MTPNTVPVREPRALRRPGRLGAGRWAVIGLAAVSLAGCVVAPQRRVAAAPPPPAARPAMYFYPAQGQTVERQDRDRFECYQWARSQTGADPGMTPIRVPAPEAAPPRVTGAGAAVGAVTGATIGAATAGRHGGGEAMVMGAIIGTILGAAAEGANAQAQAEVRSADSRSRQSRAAVQLQDAFRRAMGACMSSRGYTIG